MPRLRLRDLRPVAVRRRVAVQEPDGTKHEDWAPTGHVVMANVQPAGGRMLAEMYGQRLAYMQTLFVPYGTDIRETDGLLLYASEKPDYQVVAVRPWTDHVIVDAEKVR